jgi:oxygen-independent coproporphyrinogen-3 oxidase
MILVNDSNLKSEILRSIRDEKKADYIYMYPPRQTYRPINFDDIEFHLENSLSKFDEVELYIHFPFCNQICSFCNLFAVVEKDKSLLDEYIKCITKEIDLYSEKLIGKKINTLYLGGGTPSLFAVHHFEKLFEHLEKKLKVNVKDIAEVSMEVSPDTVDLVKFQKLIEIGLTRVNLGVQSLNDIEVDKIGRKYSVLEIIEAIKTLKETGLDNLSVDLIYGLPNQLFRDWTNSLESAIKLNPDTICLYPFTIRKFTGFAKTNSNENDERYSKFDYGRQKLEASGYTTETHVRWVKQNSKGGYIQKKNHWALKNVLGLGAGARSYLWEVDKRNGYSVRHRKHILENYINSVNSQSNPTNSGIIMTEDERKRKAVILNLIDLNKQWYNNLFNSDILLDFKKELSFLLEENLLINSDTRLSLTPKGLRHRDTIVQLFFSDRVRKLVSGFDYNE